jgi:hypothetical protein
LGETDYLVQVVLRLISTRIKYQRLYMKIQDALAKVGGLINGTTLTLKMFYFFYERSMYFIALFSLLELKNEDYLKTIVSKRIPSYDISDSSKTF